MKKQVFLTLLSTLFISANFAQQSDFSGAINGQTFCTNDTPINLTADNDTTGTFSGFGVTDHANGTATFDPGAAGSGTDSISYEISHEFTRIDAGDVHTLALKSDGTLWAWGFNFHGQLGDGTNIDKNTPIQINTDTNWSKISLADDHTHALKSDGSLWAWGLNAYGQLGDGTYSRKNSPTQIGTNTDWSQIAAGGRHTLALKNNGTLWASGRNNYGQLGDGTNINKNTLTQIGTDTNWSQIAAGYVHTLALKNNGTLWAWGNNGEGQLGDGTNTDKNTPTQIGTNTDWSQIAAGYYHTIALKNDSTLWVWGYNDDGQLGDGTTTNKYTPTQIGGGTDWSKISASEEHTLALKNNGTLWAWGFNGLGQLGDGTTTSKNSPTQIGTGTDWNQMTAGRTHTHALKNDGTLWAWGNNSNGQLGNGTTSNKIITPILINTPTIITSISVTVALPSTGIDTITSCGSYTWIDGVTYTSSNNTATHTLTNVAGCDSLVTLDLTVDYSTTGTDVQTSCDSYTWIDGVTYTSSNNTATHTLTNAAGCDSLLTLDLTVDYSTTGTDVQTSCDSYTWIDGVTYTSSNNTATHTLTNVAGCDSIVTLNLTINSTTSTDVQTSCDNYTWIDGVTYTSSNNTATHILTNTAGCDSIITLNLTIYSSLTENYTETICEGNEYSMHGFNYNQTGTFRDTLSYQSGCDSIRFTLNLTVDSVAEETYSETICEGGVFSVHGFNYDQTGIYFDTISRQSSCDSIVFSVDLTVNSIDSTFDTQVTCIPADTGVFVFNETNSNTCDSVHTLTISLDNCIGIEENNFFDLVSIYPNPAKDILIVEIKTAHLKERDISGGIYSLEGKLLQNLRLEEGTNTVNVNQHAAGLYFLQLISKGEQKVFKVVLEP